MKKAYLQQLLRRVSRVFFAALAAAVFVCSCADDSHFRVEGTSTGDKNMNLRFAFNSPEGYKSGVVAVRDGSFEFTGVSSRPTVVEFYTHDLSLLGRFYATNGEDYRLTITPGTPRALKAGGNDVSERWTRFLNDYATARGAVLDSAISVYVGANPDDIVSGLLLNYDYNSSAHPLEADSLLNLLSAQARPDFIMGGYSFVTAQGGDPRALEPIDSIRFLTFADTMSTYRFRRPVTALIFSTGPQERTDSLLDAIENMHSRGVKVLDISLAPDTLAWRRDFRREDKRTDRPDLRKSRTPGWMAGARAHPLVAMLRIPRERFIIITDSTGRQIYRGSAIAPAEAAAIAAMPSKNNK